MTDAVQDFFQVLWEVTEERDPSILPGQMKLDFGQATIQNLEINEKMDNIVSKGESDE